MASASPATSLLFIQSEVKAYQSYPFQVHASSHYDLKINTSSVKFFFIHLPPQDFPFVQFRSIYILFLMSHAKHLFYHQSNFDQTRQRFIDFTPIVISLFSKYSIIRQTYTECDNARDQLCKHISHFHSVNNSNAKKQMLEL